MEYVITGASGFIGVEISKILLNKGDIVYAVCRKTSKGLSNIPQHDNLKIVWADLDHLSEIPSQVNHADIFIHLAWEGTISGGRFNTEIQERNITNAFTAMKVAKEIGCQLFVDSGSQAEYGTYTELITEETPCNPFSDYGKAKLEVWNKGQNLCKELGLKYIHLRIFSMYGVNDHPYTLVMTIVEKMLKNERDIDLSSCTQMWNYVYCPDASRIIIALCEYAIRNKKFRAEIYNIASDDTRELKEFVERIKQLTTSSSNCNYGAIIPSNLVSLNPSIKKAMSVTNIRFTPFDDVIRLIIEKLSHNIPSLND
jgi:nucleoside-diphosphate-sugar epimerase